MFPALALAIATLDIAEAAELPCDIQRPAPESPLWVYHEMFIIFFDSDSTEVTRDSTAILDQVARVYAPLSHCDVVIAAHADRSGPASYNQALSTHRARAVARQLRRRGVNARFVLQSYGEARPLGETADGVPHPENRRAEINVSPPGQSRPPGGSSEIREVSGPQA